MLIDFGIARMGQLAGANGDLACDDGFEANDRKRPGTVLFASSHALVATSSTASTMSEHPDAPVFVHPVDATAREP